MGESCVAFLGSFPSFALESLHSDSVYSSRPLPVAGLKNKIRSESEGGRGPRRHQLGAPSPALPRPRPLFSALRKKKLLSQRPKTNDKMAGIDSSATPPLSEAERKIKKDQKKAKKLERRAAAAAAAAEDGEEEASETPAVVEKKDKKEKKRKAPVEEDEVVATEEAAPAVEDSKKSKKSKKNKTAVDESTPTASTSTSTVAPPSSSEISAFLTSERVSHDPEDAATSFPPVLSFAALPLEDGIRKGLAAYTKPTPIQSASFPVMMGGRDVVGIAETG